MLSTIYYLVRSRQDGQYLVARLKNKNSEQENQYILVFSEDYDARSYLNAHAGDIAHHFSVESLAPNQLKGVLTRWGFHGIALVREPLEPKIDFLLP